MVVRARTADSAGACSGMGAKHWGTFMAAFGRHAGWQCCSDVSAGWQPAGDSPSRSLRWQLGRSKAGRDALRMDDWQTATLIKLNAPRKLGTI